MDQTFTVRVLVCDKIHKQTQSLHPNRRNTIFFAEVRIVAIVTLAVHKLKWTVNPINEVFLWFWLRVFGTGVAIIDRSARYVLGKRVYFNEDVSIATGTFTIIKVTDTKCFAVIVPRGIAIPVRNWIRVFGTVIRDRTLHTPAIVITPCGLGTDTVPCSQRTVVHFFAWPHCSFGVALVDAWTRRIVLRYTDIYITPGHVSWVTEAVPYRPRAIITFGFWHRKCWTHEWRPTLGFIRDTGIGVTIRFQAFITNTVPYRPRAIITFGFWHRKCWTHEWRPTLGFVRDTGIGVTIRFQAFITNTVPNRPRAIIWHGEFRTNERGPTLGL